MLTTKLELRPAVVEDETFLQNVYASTRTDEMALVDWTEQQKADFLRMQFRAQHTFYHAEFPDAAYEMILKDGHAIGRLYVYRQKTEIRVLDITLLPEYRGSGIGTFLMRSIIDEASAGGRCVTLHVETFNRARHLYDRLGFKPVRNDGIYLFMEWKQSYGDS